MSRPLKRHLTGIGGFDDLWPNRRYVAVVELPDTLWRGLASVQPWEGGGADVITAVNASDSNKFTFGCTLLASERGLAIDHRRLTTDEIGANFLLLNASDCPSFWQSVRVNNTLAGIDEFGAAFRVGSMDAAVAVQRWHTKGTRVTVFLSGLCPPVNGKREWDAAVEAARNALQLEIRYIGESLTQQGSAHWAGEVGAARRLYSTWLAGIKLGGRSDSRQIAECAAELLKPTEAPFKTIAAAVELRGAGALDSGACRRAFAQLWQL